jgi:hypothetical protein
MTKPAISDVPFRRRTDLLTTKRVFDVAGENGYQLLYPDLGLTFDISRLRRDRSELIGELAVMTDMSGARTVDGVLSIANFNLSSLTARRDRAKYLGERANAQELDWAGALEELCQRVLKAEQTGSPVVPLASLAKPSTSEEFEVAGIPLLQRHPVIWFGDGGSAKSYLALYVAAELASRGIPVLYADWEFAGEDHRDRLERLCGHDMPLALSYTRCQAPLTEEVGRLRGWILKSKIQYIVCDSLAFASDGPPEASETCSTYFRAVRALGIGSLHIAHISKGSGDDENTKKPFGSIFWHNGARSTWFLKRANDQEDGDCVEVALYHRKANIGRLRPAIGLRVSFDPVRTLITTFDVAESVELGAKEPLWKRMKAALRRGALTTGELAEALDAKPDAIRQAVHRFDRTFARVGEDGAIGLRAQVRDERVF